MSTELAPPNGGGTSITKQGFDGASLEKRHETASTAVAAQAQAEITARYLMAMQRPRDDDNVRVRLLKECSRPSFAQRAFFSVQRGNKPGRITGAANRIEGLSVRFAEAAIRHMGNCMVSTRAVYDDAEKRIINVTVVDLETNAVHGKDVVIGKTVERRKLGQGQVALKTRTNSFGDVVFIVEATDDELLQKENALVSKTLRTEGLRLLSADSIEECEQKIIETIRSHDAKDPDSARKALADGFAMLNVMPSDLKAYLGHELAQCSPAQLTDLRGLFAAIREGETTWAEVMAGKAEASGKTEEPKAQEVAAAKPEGRAGRLTQKVKGPTASPPVDGDGAAVAQQPAATVAVTAAHPPQGAPKASAEPPDLFGPQPSQPPAKPVQQGAAANVEQSSTAAAAPVPTKPTSAPSIADERAAELARQADLASEWSKQDSVGVAVVVELANGKLFEGYTKSMGRMFGDMAVINIEGIDGPMPLNRVKRAT